MAKLSIEHLRYLLEQLDPNCAYKYINPATKRTLSVVGFVGDSFKYVSNDEGQPQKRSVSKANILKLLPNIYEYVPFSIDALVNASGNWRSGFESILAHTSEFFTCKVNNQKHLVWAPDKNHAVGEIGIWEDYSLLRDAYAEKIIHTSTIELKSGEHALVSQDTLVSILENLYKQETRSVARLLFGLKFHDIITEHALDYIISKTKINDNETIEQVKREIHDGMRLSIIAQSRQYGISSTKSPTVQDSLSETTHRSEQKKNSQE